MLVSRHWDLRFCSRDHKELYLNQALQRSKYVKQWLGYLGPTPPKTK